MVIDLFEELLFILVCVAAIMVAVIIAIFVGTLALNANFSAGWIALLLGGIAIGVGVWKIPVPTTRTADDHHDPKRET